MRVPQIIRAVAVTGGETRLHVPHRVMPIIIVPGLLGTRLADARTGKLVWNPMGAPFGQSPRAFKVDYDRLNQPTPLVPAERQGFQDARRQRYEHIRGIQSLVVDTYGDLALRLADLSTGTFEHFGVKTRVYCAGYDWRLDHAHAALSLSDVVEEALIECRAETCVIVAHGTGGLVARYYAHVLGGERRIHALYLLGSPTLGAPTAYVQLKTGLKGTYLRDMGEAMDRGDVLGMTREVVSFGTGLATGLVEALASGNPLDAFGATYVSMCLGAGRFLSRPETRYLLRQWPAFYQMLPNAAYCHDNKYWVVFDPLATGHPPTGTMLVFPTMLDQTVLTATEALRAIDAGGAAVADQIEKTLKPGAALRTSERADRNVVRLEEIAEEMAEAFGKIESEADGYQIHRMYKQIREIYDRAEECFLNCQSHEDLYRDIYTGLLDVIGERSITATGVELGLRFDEALSVGDGGPGPTGMGIVKTMLRPLVRALQSSGGEDDDRDADHGEREGPKVYMHPNTTVLYGEGMLVDSGAMLFPLEILSNDDSNEVHQMMVPLPFAMGDGMVPSASASPPDNRLSNALTHSNPFPMVGHNQLPKNDSVITYLAQRLELVVESFCTGEP